MKKFSLEELQKLHGQEYVNRYHSIDYVRIKRLLKRIKFNKSDIVLDVGCGNGLLLDHIHNKIKLYYGVDFSREFIMEAKIRKKDNSQNSVFICGDVINLCKSYPKRFDKIFALDFTEHIYDEDFIKIFSAVKSSLKDNGELFIHTPNRNYILEILKEKGVMRQFPEHVGIRSSDQYKIILRRCGFKKVKVAYLPHYIKSLYFFDLFKYAPLIGNYFVARLFIRCQK